jgi:hypothetical protein
MFATSWRRNRRAGVLLDAVLAIALIVLGAFALNAIGLRLSTLLEGAGHFFGL